MKTENATWIGMDIDYRTDKRTINDVFCKACRRKLAKIFDHRLINLNGWDSLATIDMEKKTVTVKCKCGVCQVIRCRGDDHEGVLDVWYEEIDESPGGKPATNSQGEGGAD